jgi:Right handed beta helix region
MRTPSSLTLLRTVATAVAVVVLMALTPGSASAAVRCGQVVRSDFTLRRDLLNCGGDGLVVGADNITLNLNGHELRGKGLLSTAGVRIDGFEGVVVRGGVIRQFGRGLWVIAAPDTTLRGNTVRRSVEEGIFADKSSFGALVARNTVIASGTGQATWADGIDAQAEGASIRANVVRRSFDDGIDANGDNLRLMNNRMVANGADGIDVDGDGVLIAANFAVRNGDDGIGVGLDAGTVTFEANTANRNTDLGMEGNERSVSVGNHAADNGDARQCIHVQCS